MRRRDAQVRQLRHERRLGHIGARCGDKLAALRPDDRGDDEEVRFGGVGRAVACRVPQPVCQHLLHVKNAERDAPDTAAAVGPKGSIFLTIEKP
jgi:hypothetical protein